MAALDDKYIVFGAKTECSMGLRESKLVLPADHGIFIRGKAQMHAKDCVSVTNVIPFGGCRRGCAAQYDACFKCRHRH